MASEGRSTPFDVAPMALVELDESGCCVHAAGGLLEELSLCAEDLLGRQIEGVLGDLSLGESIRSALLGGSSVALTEHRGRFFELSFSPDVRADGEVERVVVVIADVSERERLRRELRRSNERLARAIGVSPIGMLLVVLDPQGSARVVSVNEALVEMLGRSSTQLCGGTLEELVHGEDRGTLRQALTRVAGGRVEELKLEQRYLRDDGEVLHVLLRASVSAVDESGTPTLLVQLCDITARREAEEANARRAFLDPLTGLPNRLLLMDRLELALAKLNRRPSSAALMVVDLDDFRRINDELGYSVGDEVLATVGQRLSSAMRASDTVARLGADEFVILIEDLGSADDIAVVSTRLRVALEEPLTVGGGMVTLTASVGICQPSADDDATSVLHNADSAMHRAKEAGKAGTATYERLVITN